MCSRRPVPLIPRTIPAVGLKLPLQPRTVPAPGLQVLQHYRPAAIPGLHLRLQSRTASIMVAKKMENEKACLKDILKDNYVTKYGEPVQDGLFPCYHPVKTLYIRLSSLLLVSVPQWTSIIPTQIRNLTM